VKRTIALLVMQELQHKDRISLSELRAIVYQCKTEAQLLRTGSCSNTIAARKYKDSVPLSEEEFSHLLYRGVRSVAAQFIYSQTKQRKNPWLERIGDSVRLKATTEPGLGSGRESPKS